jgi:hypothetical protein
VLDGFRSAIEIRDWIVDSILVYDFSIKQRAGMPQGERSHPLAASAICNAAFPSKPVTDLAN